MNIKLILFIRPHEREDTPRKCKKNNASAENISFIPRIFVAQHNFWCHVHRRPLIRFEQAWVLRRKPKIRDFDVEELIHQNILELQVAVRDALALHEFDGSYYFAEECAGAIFAESAQVLANFEQESSGDVFHDDVDDLLLYPAWGFHDAAVVAEVVDADDVFVLEGFEDGDFFYYLILSLFIAFDVLVFQDFDGELRVGVLHIVCEVDFWSFTFSEFATELVFTVHYGEAMALNRVVLIYHYTELLNIISWIEFFNLLSNQFNIYYLAS